MQRTSSARATCFNRPESGRRQPPNATVQPQEWGYPQAKLSQNKTAAANAYFMGGLFKSLIEFVITFLCSGYPPPYPKHWGQHCYGSNRKQHSYKLSSRRGFSGPDERTARKAGARRIARGADRSWRHRGHKSFARIAPPAWTWRQLESHSGQSTTILGRKPCKQTM
jgi:hypothetical protein